MLVYKILYHPLASKILNMHVLFDVLKCRYSFQSIYMTNGPGGIAIAFHITFANNSKI